MKRFVRTLNTSAPQNPQAEPPPQDRASASALLRTFRGNPLGYWSDNRHLQVTKLRDLVYIAINAVQDAFYGATVTVLKRKKPGTNKTTFGPGNSVARPASAGLASVAKSVNSGQQNRDEEYTPFDDEEHPLVAKMRKPNEHQTINEVLSYLVMQLGLTGEQFLWCLPNEKGRPVEYYALPSALTFPQLQPGQDPRYPHGAYRVNPSYPAGGWGYAPGALATNAILPAQNVKRAHKPHPYHLWSGYSPLSACARAVDILEALDKSRWSAMQHGPALDAVLLLEGITDKNVLKAIADDLTNQHGGADNHHKVTAIGLPPGMRAQGALQNVGTNAKELDWVNSWKQIADLVLATYGVPPDVAGLEESGSYSKLYANQQQFYLRHQNGAKKQGDFLTRAAADPWSSFDGEFVVQVELQKPQDVTIQQQQTATALQNGTMTVNEERATRNYPPVEGGDVPPQVYQQMMMQKFAPQPAPGDQMGGMGGDVNAQSPDSQGMGDADQQDDPTQSATVQAALGALGVPGAGDTVAKSLTPTKPGGTAPRKVRQEGERWQANGKWYTKRGGKIVQTAAPGTAAPRQQPAGPARYPSRHDPSVTYGNVHDRNSDDRHIDKLKAAAAKAAAEVEAIKKQLADAENPPAIRELQTRLDEATQRAVQARAKANQLRQAASAGKSPQTVQTSRTASAPQTNANATGNAPAGNGAPPAVNPANPQQSAQNLDKLAETVRRGHNFVRMYDGAGRPHEIRDGASLRRFFEAGGRLEDDHFAQTAVNLARQTQTPEAKQQLATVGQWAATHADKHADRVAAHFGISRERAHALLVHAITAVANHAAKGGGSVGVTIRDPRTGKTARLAPKKPLTQPSAGAVPRPSNPAAKGSGVPRVAKADTMSALELSAGGALVPEGQVTSVRRKRRGKMRRVFERVLKSFEGE